MKMNIKNLLCAGAIALALVGCGGGGGGGVSNTNKTISGLALKADGTTFSEGSTVLAVDTNGNTSSGTVDANGKYTVTLTGVASSGKKGKLIDGNSFLNVSDGVDSMDLVVSEDQTTINFNAVTSASSALIIQSSDLDLAAIFDAVDSANGKKGKGEITNAGVLAALARVQVLTKEIFGDTAQSVVGALFGFDSQGNAAVDAEKLLTGDAKAKEVTLIKAAAKVTGNLVSAAVTASNNPDNTSFLLNDEDFFAAVGEVLADAEGTASDNAFSDFLNSVLQSSEMKDALKTLSDELNAYVAAVEADSNATFSVDIPEIAENAPTVEVSVTRSGDTISYTAAGDLAGDTSNITVYVLSASDEDVVQATITVKLTSNGTSFSAGTAEITVTSGDVSVKVSNTLSLATAGTIDLAVALAEAKAVLVANSQTTTADKLPSDLSSSSFFVTADNVSRSGTDTVSTYITVGGESVTANSGIFIE